MELKLDDDRNAAAFNQVHIIWRSAAAIVLAVFEIVFDLITSIELNVAVLYTLPLIFAAISRSRRLLWSLTVLLVFTTFVVYFAQISSAFPSLAELLFVDRTLTAITVITTAGILDVWLQALRKLELRDRSIQERNVHLECANRELRNAKEKITRQNLALEASRGEIESISIRKTQMLASISHDIRTPIHAITLLAELVRRSAERPERIEKLPELAQRLQSSALSVVDFLSQVIDVASFDTGRMVVHSSEFILDQLLREQRQRLLPIADDKKLAFVVSTTVEPLCLSTDRVKLGRVIANLAANAIKFTSSGSVTFESGLNENGGVFIRVIDTGRGIEPENLVRIFEEFTQVDGVEPQSGSGWGLGLAISRRMVYLLGGDISVDSRLGAGSIFTVFLPSSCVVSPIKSVSSLN
jgi:signal transduction histidine kinase